MKQVEAKQIREFDNEVLRHYSTKISSMKDHKALEEMFADDYLSVIPDGSLLNKEQVIKGFENGEPEIRSIKETEDSLRTFGDTALHTGKLTLEGNIKQYDISGDYRFTHVFKKNGDRWELLHAQLTPIVKR